MFYITIRPNNNSGQQYRLNEKYCGSTVRFKSVILQSATKQIAATTQIAVRDVVKLLHRPVPRLRLSHGEDLADDSAVLKFCGPQVVVHLDVRRFPWLG